MFHACYLCFLLESMHHDKVFSFVLLMGAYLDEFHLFQIWFQVITIGRERYMVGEALFQPSILGLEAHGIVEQLVRSISTVSSENHRQLLENTVLCGGTVSMAGECCLYSLTNPSMCGMIIILWPEKLACWIHFS